MSVNHHYTTVTINHNVYKPSLLIHIYPGSQTAVVNPVCVCQTGSWMLMQLVPN